MDLMTNRRNRLSVLALCFALFAASCGTATNGSTDASDQTTTDAPSAIASTENSSATPMQVIRVSALGTLDSSPLWIADSQGFFEEAGIDVQFVPRSGANAVGASLLDDTVDAIAISATQVVKLVAAGEPIRITNYLNSTSPEAARHSMTLVADESSELETGCDLEGKRVGINETESLVAHAVTQMVINDGCDGNSIQFVEGPLTDQPDLLVNDQADAIAVFEPYTARATRLGFVEVANLDRELCPGSSRCPIGVVAMQDSFVEENPVVSEEFNRAISRALLWMESNPVESRAELVLCCGITVEDASEIRVFDWVANFAALERDMARLLDVLEAQGKLPRRPALDDLLG